MFAINPLKREFVRALSGQMSGQASEITYRKILLTNGLQDLSGHVRANMHK